MQGQCSKNTSVSVWSRADFHLSSADYLGARRDGPSIARIASSKRVRISLQISELTTHEGI